MAQRLADDGRLGRICQGTGLAPLLFPVPHQRIEVFDVLIGEPIGLAVFGHGPLPLL